MRLNEPLQEDYEVATEKELALQILKRYKETLAKVILLLFYSWAFYQAEEYLNESSISNNNTLNGP